MVKLFFFCCFLTIIILSQELNQQSNPKLNQKVKNNLTNKNSLNPIKTKLKWQYESLFSYYLYNKKISFLSGTIFNNFCSLKWKQSSLNFSSKLNILSEKETENIRIAINRFIISLQYGSYIFSQKKIKFYFNLDYEYFDYEKSFYINSGIGGKYNFIKSSKNLSKNSSKDLLKEISISLIFFTPIKFITNVYSKKESFFNNIIYSLRPKVELTMNNVFFIDLIYFLKYYQKEQNKISSELQIKPKIKVKKNLSILSNFSFLQYDIINEVSRYDVNLYFGFKIKQL